MPTVHDLSSFVIIFTTSFTVGIGWWLAKWVAGKVLH